jgi:PPK2 family polyphosphate:nucleotide phosphotransferase
VKFWKEHRLEVGRRVKLAEIPTKVSGTFENKEQARAFAAETNEEIRDLQYRLFVERRQSLLIVLQAPDAAGKDGLMRNVLGKMNPQGCRTYPFKAPSTEELAHDFLWRIHRCTPGRGNVSVFNRSHYEDVLVVRVEDLVPRNVWSRRYDAINHFEQNLVDHGTKILKFYLHISPEEQLERFKKRLDNPAKHWKLNVGDYRVRDKWNAYREAYEQALERCNHADSPWYVIPADQKWYRDAAVAAIVRDTLAAMNPQMPPVDVDLEEIRSLYERELAD